VTFPIVGLLAYCVVVFSLVYICVSFFVYFTVYLIVSCPLWRNKVHIISIASFLDRLPEFNWIFISQIYSTSISTELYFRLSTIPPKSEFKKISSSSLHENIHLAKQNIKHTAVCKTPDETSTALSVFTRGRQ